MDRIRRAVMVLGRDGEWDLAIMSIYNVTSALYCLPLSAGRADILPVLLSINACSNGMFCISTYNTSGTWFEQTEIHLTDTSPATLQQAEPVGMDTPSRTEVSSTGRSRRHPVRWWCTRARREGAAWRTSVRREGWCHSIGQTAGGEGWQWEAIRSWHTHAWGRHAAGRKGRAATGRHHAHGWKGGARREGRTGFRETCKWTMRGVAQRRTSSEAQGRAVESHRWSTESRVGCSETM